MKFIRFVVAAVLATGALAALPTSAEADASGGLYWSNVNLQTLSSGTLSGAVTAESLATLGNAPWGIATDGSYIYWTHEDGVGRTPIGGGTSTTLFVTRANAMNVAVDTQFIYITAANGVYRAPISGGTATQIVDAGFTTNAIAVDGTYVYWTTSTTIGRAKLDGSSPEPTFIDASLGAGGGLVVTSDKIYVNGFSDNWDIASVDKTGGALSILFMLPNPANAGLATDGTYLYWSNSCVASTCVSGNPATTSFSNTIGRVKLDGSGQVNDFVTGNGDIYGVLALTKATQTISFTQPDDIGIQHGPITLKATASSGLEVSFKSNDTTVCTVAGSTVTFAKAGTCSITASQAGNASYAAAPEVTNTFAIQPLPGALASVCAPNGSCAGVSISGANLEKANLSGIDFTGAKIIGNSSFANANLTGANFTDVILDNVSFSGADFTGAKVIGLQSDNVNFTSAKFSSSSIQSAQFKNSDFTGAKFVSATVLGTLFYKCKLPFSLFVDTKLFRSGVQLRAKSKVTSFVGANLKGANFSGADARQVNFSKANLTKAKFTKADVRKANFKKATLKGAKFKGAKTKGAKGL